MKIIIALKYFLFTFFVCMFSFFSAKAYAHCATLREATCVKVKIIEKVPVCKAKPKKHHYKKHIKRPVKHKRKRLACASCCQGFNLDDSCHCPCVRDCAPQREFVEFIPYPAPAGCYVDLDVCEKYELDRSTGDDDPMVYPGMNIDE